MGIKLKKSFYLRKDALTISRELLGKVLVSNLSGRPKTSGMIVETEAYIAPEDKASHAFNYKRTKRTATMFMEGGTAYVYLCYGIHAMFNVITHQVGIPHAILVRAIEPIEGIDTMLQRRNKAKKERTLTAGPGCVSQALGITTKLNASSVLGDQVWIEDRGNEIVDDNIKATSRVGIPSAGEYKDKPWRFKVADSKWTSKP